MVASRILVALPLLMLGATHAAPPQDETASDYEIQLKTRRFTPEPGLPRALAAARAAPGARTHVVVQFWAPPSPELLPELEKRGVKLLSYIGGTSYWASVPASLELEEAGGRTLFRWVSPLEAADKVHPALVDRALDDLALVEAARAAGDRVNVLVQTFPDVSDESITREFRRLRIEAARHGTNTWAVTATRDQIRALSAVDGVKLLEPGPMPFLELNDTTRRLIHSDEAQQGVFTAPQPAYRMSGAGVDVGICDSGVDDVHNDFHEVAANGTAGASRVYASRPGSGGHGTHVASIAAGSGLNSAANASPAFSLRGEAPAARIGDYAGFGANVASYHGAILTDGTDVTNHSYVQSFTVYGSEAADIDSIVRGDAVHNSVTVPARAQVWAAGNNGTSAQYGNEEGYYAVFTSAKNTISVGSVDSIDGRLSDYSSLGPTFDGRIKPDVVGPGCQDSIAAPSVGIRAADDGTQGYTTMCGTSMAAPAVTGLTAAIMEQYQQTYGVPPGLLPSTYKAMLVHTARDLVKTAAYGSREFDNPDTSSAVLYHVGPDFATGYGLVDTEAFRDIVTRSAQWREGTLAATGSSRSYCFNVPAGSEGVKVTLAWDDLPGDTTTAETAAKLVNDLDLELYDPAGNVVHPWTLDPLPLTANPGDGAPDPIQAADVRPAYRAPDHRNNVEMATACAGTPGFWRAVVRAHALPMGRPQSFSLVTSHPLRPFCWLPPPDWCRRYPWLCRHRPVCERYPWVCERPGFVIPGRDHWEITGGGPIPIDDICKYVVNCPGCGGVGYCPGWRVEMRGLPPDVVASAVNDRGEVVREGAPGGPARFIQVSRQRAGEQWLLVFSDASGRPFERKLDVSFGLKPVR